MSTQHDPFAPETRDNPTGFRTREFTVRAERSGDEDDAPLRIAISSEAPVERYDWRTGEIYDEVLDHGENGPDLEYVRDGLPFCLDHDLRAQIGLGTPPTIDADGTLRTEVRRGNHPDAAWVFADMAAGIRQKVSIGYWPGERYVQTKDTRNGRITRRYQGWTLYEASSVAVPADYAVGVGRSAEGAASISQAERTAPAHSTESSMDGQHTSERGAAPAPDTRAAELAALAIDGGMPEKAAEWIRSNTSVEQARQEVIAALRAAKPAPMAPAPVIEVGTERETEKPWTTAGEFFGAVITAERAPGRMDPRLRASGANTQIPSEGGFAVPAAQVGMFLDTMYQSGEILSRVTRRPITAGNTYSEVMVKESSRVSGSRFGGITTAWVGEGNDITATKPALRAVNLTLRKVAAASYLTEEQVADGPALESFIREAAPEALRYAVEDAIYNGLGAGQPLGFVNGGGLVSVAIEATQTIANTSQFIWNNVAKMYARMPAGMRAGAAWFMNPELYAKIITSTAGASTNGAAPIFMMPGRLQDAPAGAILGRPIVPVEYSAAEGTVGDIVFANLSDYLLIEKGGIAQASSLHVRFLQDEQVLKFTYRVDGSPRTNVAITPANGTATQSPYVALAARS